MLEISSRQTGKTHRLLLAALANVNINNVSDNSSIIVVYSPEAVLMLTEKLANGLSYNDKPHGIKIIAIDDLSPGMLDNHIIFYDEFDMYLDQIPKLRAIDYYVGSPTKLRTLPDDKNDRIFDLLKIHKYCYKHHIADPNELIVFLNNSPKMIATEIYGEFLAI